MSTIYVCADLHFGHTKVALARGFPNAATHNAVLRDAWMRTVTKRDVVYVLGDVFNQDWLQDLPGTKKLVLGNHDQRPMSVYSKVFSKIYGSYEFDGCLLTHIPVHPSQFGRYRLNVHGHTHGHSLADLRYVPVSMEVCPHYAPLPLRELISKADSLLAGATKVE